MYIEQIYTNCLAEAAYYIESNGEAAIVDPLRDVSPYVELAESRGAKIKYIFETHFHADFISGHVDLARNTGAQIVYGPSAKAQYDITVAEDFQEFPLGDINIKVLHTPGHTMESSCFLVINEQGEEEAIFTGDTLFIGDVGRPDLAVSADVSREDLARYLYHSIQDKILTLGDDVIVYPGHGAGSQCGKNLSSETVSTIGNQRNYNYALQETSEEGFVKAITDGLSNPPQYFPKVAGINKAGYKDLDDVLKASNKELDVVSFNKYVTEGALIIDIRNKSLYCEGHIPGSINIGMDGFFAVWTGTLVEDLNQPILLVGEGDEKDAIIRLARVGYENVLGYLKGGFSSWVDENLIQETIDCICPVSFKKKEYKEEILDVRTCSEYGDSHVEGAISVPLAKINQELSNLDKYKKYFVYCKSGYRSAIACSILKKAGFENVVNINKGFDALSDPEMECSCSTNNN